MFIVNIGFVALIVANDALLVTVNDIVVFLLKLL